MNFNVISNLSYFIKNESNLPKVSMNMKDRVSPKLPHKIKFTIFYGIKCALLIN